MQMIAIAAVSMLLIAAAQTQAQVKHYSEWKTCTDGKWTCNAWCETNKPGVVTCTSDCTERHRQCMKDGTYWWGASRGPLTKQ